MLITKNLRRLERRSNVPSQLKLTKVAPRLYLLADTTVLDVYVGK